MSETVYLVSASEFRPQSVRFTGSQRPHQTGLAGREAENPSFEVAQA
jgi:hypothetical protein